MTMKFPRRSLFYVLCLLCGLVVLGSFTPGPVEGMWYPKILDCMCNSRNLVEFKQGYAVISSDHNEKKMRGSLGKYSKEGGVWVWEINGAASVSELELYPTWFFIRIIDRKSGERHWGYRVLWPPSIRDARSKQSVKPAHA